MHRRILGAGSLAFAVGCASSSTGGSSGPPPPAATCNASPVLATGSNVVSAAGENVDTTCASVDGYFPWKSGAAGSACTDPLDCAPVCCPCANGTHHALATWCNAGTCAAPETVCCMVLGTPLKACGG